MLAVGDPITVAVSPHAVQKAFDLGIRNTVPDDKVIVVEPVAGVAATDLALRKQIGIADSD